MNLWKLVFYMFFYLHCLACTWNWVIHWNSPEQFRLNEERGIYESDSGDIYRDEFGGIIEYVDDKQVLFG